MVQDSRVETYLQSQEEEGSGMLADVQAWAQNATASLQRLVQQALPARQNQHTLDEPEGVSMATVTCNLAICGALSHQSQCIRKTYVCQFCAANSVQ